LYDYAFEPTDIASLDATCSRLRAAQPRWAALGLEGRIEILRRFTDLIKAGPERLRDSAVADTGNWASGQAESNLGPRLEREVAIALTAGSPEGWSSRANGFSAEAQWVPYPLVGNITPWNSPVNLAFLDTFHALLAGCAVIVKPSEITPRVIPVIAEFIEAVPELANALAFIQGDGALGAALIGKVDYVCFTGSVPTGRKVLETASRAFVPVSLELGGKDPLIVLEGADVEAAAISAVIGGCVGNGQNCFSTERIYVADSLYDDFVDALVAQARRVRPNFPNIREGFLGPFIMERQAAIVAAQLADARERGAEILTGGEIIDHGGLWCLPTVVTGVDHQMLLMREETFGPVLPVMRFQDEDEAVALANDTVYGLSAEVCGPIDRARHIAARLNAGGVSINRWLNHIGMRSLEQDSFGYSGFGHSRIGREGFLRFHKRKSIVAYDGGDPEKDSPMGRAAFS
jgi:acyl-CoA reductase-like NAD-dependent aldehyde dehydrogenase